MRAFLLLVSVFLSIQVWSQSKPDGKFGVFDTVKTVTFMKRIDVAHDIYYQKVRRSDSVFAIKSIRQLMDLADAVDNEELKCFAISTLADHYARIRGFNSYSIQLHSEAIQLAHNSKMLLAEGMSYFKAGRYFYNHKKFPFAFEYMLKAENILKKVGYRENYESGEFLLFFGNIYYEMRDYEKAESLYKEALKYCDHEIFFQIQAKNTIASIAKDQRKYDKALKYLKEISQTSIASKDAVWEALSNGFIGDILYLKTQFQEAIPYLQKGYVNNIKHHEWKNANLCILDLASISIKNNNLKEAEKFLLMSAECMKHGSGLDSRKHLYEVMIQYNEKKGNYQQALKYEKQLRLAEDSIKTRQDLKEFSAIEMKFATQKHLNEIATLETDAHNSRIKRNTIIVILSLLVITVLLIYNQYRLKAGKDAEIARQKQKVLESEKQMAESELQNAKLQLQNFTENLRHKNELIEDFRNEIEHLQKTIPESAMQGERMENFEKLLQSTILTDEEWDNFRILFDKVHKGFFFNLKEKMPNLSLAETRMCSLVKLQLSNREMAHISGVSIDAIKKAKQRLRKKITSEEIELEEILQTI